MAPGQRRIEMGIKVHDAPSAPGRADGAERVKGGHKPRLSDILYGSSSGRTTDGSILFCAPALIGRPLDGESPGGLGIGLAAAAVFHEHLFDLRYGLGDLFDAQRLFPCGIRNAGEQLGGLIDRIRKPPEGLVVRLDLTVPGIYFLTVPSMSSEVLRAASAARRARFRTSSATTAKPAPASPARAASTAALRASRFV